MAAFSNAIAILHSAETTSAPLPALQLARERLGCSAALTEDEAYLVELLEAHRHVVSEPPLRHAPAQPPSPELAGYFRLGRHGLTRRQCEVVFWIAQGKRDAEIAHLLGCAPKTVSKHVENILAKLHAETRLAAAHAAQDRLERGG
jgi:DNA-binding CsgD family transcriptional regulator